MEQIYLKCVRVIELDEGIDNTKTEDIYIIKTDDIYISKTEDIDISKTEDIDISKTEDIDISKTEDIDISKTEDEDEGTDSEKIHKVSEMDNDTQHLINDKLKEIMKQSRKILEKIVV